MMGWAKPIPIECLPKPQFGPPTLEALIRQDRALIDREERLRRIGYTTAVERPFFDPNWLIRS